MTLSSRNLLNWQTGVYWCFVPLDLLSVIISTLVLLLNIYLIPLNFLEIISRASQIYSNYIFPVHGILNWFSVVLLLVTIFRMNINLRRLHVSKSSNRFLIAIHWLIPVFDSVFRFMFFRKYQRESREIMGKRLKKFNRLNISLMLVGSVGILLSWANIIIIAKYSHKLGVVIELGTGIALYIFLFVYSIIYLRLLGILKEIDSSYLQDRTSVINDGPIDQLS